MIASSTGQIPTFSTSISGFLPSASPAGTQRSNSSSIQTSSSSRSRLRETFPETSGFTTPASSAMPIESSVVDGCSATSPICSGFENLTRSSSGFTSQLFLVLLQSSSLSGASSFISSTSLSGQTTDTGSSRPDFNITPTISHSHTTHTKATVEGLSTETWRSATFPSGNISETSLILSRNKLSTLTGVVTLPIANLYPHLQN